MAEEIEPQEEEKEHTEDDPPKRSSIKLLIMGVLVIVLGAGGILGWNMFMNKSETQAQVSETDPQQTEKEKTAITYPFDTFIVNLMDRSGAGKRYLKIGMILEIDKEGQVMILDKYKPQLRDTILILLSSKSFTDINTIDGKLELKQELLSRLNHILGSVIVRRIYFKEFVVQ